MDEAEASEHPSYGGKSIESVQAQQNALATRQVYKSWRKKYRKMRLHFDAVLEENRRLFKEEQKLENLAKRLTEELDSLLEILLDLNQNPAIAAELRFDLSYSHTHVLQEEMRKLLGMRVSAKIKPSRANELMQDFMTRMQKGEFPPGERHLVRQELQEQLACQDARGLATLESKIQPSADEIENFTRDNDLESHPAFLHPEHEDAYLARLDAVEVSFGRARDSGAGPVIHQADLPSKELERQLELMNPQSQHNWLKTHSKVPVLFDGEDADAAAQDLAGKLALSSSSSSSKKRNSSKNLARQLGDRTVLDRVMRDAYSPSSGFGEEDELAYEDSASARRRGGAEKDPTFRGKGGKGGPTKTKRKRPTDESTGGGGGGGGGKRVRASEIFD